MNYLLFSSLSSRFLFSQGRCGAPFLSLMSFVNVGNGGQIGSVVVLLVSLLAVGPWVYLDLVEVLDVVPLGQGCGLVLVLGLVDAAVPVACRARLIRTTRWWVWLPSPHS